MARLEDFDELGRDYFLSMPMPEFDGTPWIEPPPVTASRIALISTAGLQRRGDRPFSVDRADFRLIPGDTPVSDLVMREVKPPVKTLRPCAAINQKKKNSYKKFYVARALKLLSIPSHHSNE